MLDVASRAGSEFAVVGVLADACRTRRTTPQRLATILAGRARSPRRRWLNAVLTDSGQRHELGAGTRLPHRRGRAHRLPRARLQVRATASFGIVYRDAEYARRVGGRARRAAGAQHGAAARCRLRARPGRRGGRAHLGAAVLGSGHRPAVPHRGQARPLAPSAGLDRPSPPVLPHLPGPRRARWIRRATCDGSTALWVLGLYRSRARPGGSR